MRLLREQFQNKEKRLKENLDKRKKMIDSLKTENEELRSQVDFYEKMRNKKTNQNSKHSKKPKIQNNHSQDTISDEEDSHLNNLDIDDIDDKSNNDQESMDDEVDLTEMINNVAQKKGNKKKELKKILNIFYKQVQNPIPSKEKDTLKINNENYKFNENTHYKKYKFNKNKSKEVVKEEENEGKLYKTFDDGRKEIIFGNGAVKEIMPDNYTIGRFN